MKNKKLYDDNSIISLDPREFTRLRPSTYLGSNEYSTQLVKEIFANALDEHNIGHGDEITVEVDTAKHIYRVKDNGQGFPVNVIRPEDGKTILEASFSVLNTSGKYDDSKDAIYQGSSLGVNGVGSKITDYLSHWLTVTTYRGGEYEDLTFNDGLFTHRNTGKTEHESGTIVTWCPDEQFFQNVDANKADLDKLFEGISALCPKLNIKFIWDGEEKIYHSANGIQDLLDDKIKSREILNSRFLMRKISDNNLFDIALTYTSDYTDTTIAYVNYGLTESGVHISTLKAAITRQINRYALDNNLIKKNSSAITQAELSEGLYIVFNVRASNVKYDSQTKTRVVDIDKTLINSVINNDFYDWLNNNSKDAKVIIDKALLARKAKESAQAAKDAIRGLKSKKNIKNLDLPTKLIDANPRDKDRTKCILYCVEGDSAANGLISKRNGEIHGIMPLRGKILSAFKATTQEIVKNQEIQNIVKALGLEVNPENFTLKYDTKKLRYHKIVLLEDGDNDGGHIRMLLLTMFWRICPELVINGHIYSSRPPLYKITNSKNNYCYATDEVELAEYKKKHKGESITINRLKGLGEMSPDELYECMIKNDSKTVMRIIVNNAKAAENELEIFMGTDVENRRKYYNEHYNDIEIDIE